MIETFKKATNEALDEIAEEKKVRKTDELFLLFSMGSQFDHLFKDGDVYQIGETVVQVSHPRVPCWKIARRWGIKTLTATVAENGRTGWYHRVLTEGYIEEGQAVRPLERPSPDWTVMRATRVMQNRRREMAAANELAQLASLAAAWKMQLTTAGG